MEVQYFVGSMYIASMAVNVVVAPATVVSQVKPKKSTMNLFILYTAHTRMYIKNAVDAREKARRKHNVNLIDSQWSV